MHAAITIESVEVRHREKTVLGIPHLSVQKGEILAIIGPNGAGKSTLLQVLALLQKPTHGRVFFEGQEVTGRSNLVALRRRLAMVFQEPLLFRGSVYDNVSLGLRLRGVPPPEIKRRVEQWLAKLSIGHLSRRSITKISGGEAQRVNLARALVLNPEAFLLDEPFAALDSPTQASLIEDLRNILAETGITTVFVTHNRTEALMLGRRLAVMIDGHIAQLDTPENVFSRPANPAVAAFVGVETIVECRVLSSSDGASRVTMADREIVIPGAYAQGERLFICLRPEDTTVYPQEKIESIGSDINLLTGRIMTVTPLEAQFKVVVDCSFPIVTFVSKQTFIDLSLTRGKGVMLGFRPGVVHIIRDDRPAEVGEAIWSAS